MPDRNYDRDSLINSINYTILFLFFSYDLDIMLYIVNNLFTFTNYNGFDPSASSGSPIGAGIDKGFYPVSRSFLFGLNVKL